MMAARRSSPLEDLAWYWDAMVRTLRKDAAERLARARAVPVTLSPEDEIRLLPALLRTGKHERAVRAALQSLMKDPTARVQDLRDVRAAFWEPLDALVRYHEPIPAYIVESFMGPAWSQDKALVACVARMREGRGAPGEVVVAVDLALRFYEAAVQRAPWAIAYVHRQRALDRIIALRAGKMAPRDVANTLTKEGFLSPAGPCWTNEGVIALADDMGCSDLFPSRGAGKVRAYSDYVYTSDGELVGGRAGMTRRLGDSNNVGIPEWVPPGEAKRMRGARTPLLVRASFADPTPTDRVLEALERHPEGLGFNELQKVSRMKRPDLQAALRSLKADGKAHDRPAVGRRGGGLRWHAGPGQLVPQDPLIGEMASPRVIRRRRPS